ncbi:Dolichyl-monophosphooligosaccharide--protein glycotransferase AglB [uncultured archaeon]|nr:Dolichyl-monophosphooligosaccharide--protein glycotransferase AglB [uncultured archaeon]
MTKNKKKREEKSVRAGKDKEQKLNFPSYFGYVAGIILLAIFVLSLYLRTVMPYDSVFRNGYVAFASDDAVFQMRLVENTLNNFPHRLFYDAFTVYPTGTAIHWGPLWTQMIATLSLIAGLGSYNMQTVNAIAAYFPAVMGALVVFPVYYIGKLLYNRSAGLLAAFMIAVLPGQFFSRSTLGFTDHHVAEVFFSTAAMALFMLAIKAGRERNIKLSGLNLKENLKEKPVLYSILAGIMLAAFHITWPGALFFIMIFLIFIFVQFIVDHLRGRSTDYIVVAAVPMFLIELIAVLPYVHSEYGFGISNYSWFHVAVPIAGMAVPAALNILSKEIKERGYNPLYYPLSLVALFAAALLGLKIILPNLFDSLMEAPGLIFAVHTGGAATVGEGQSIFTQAGGMVWGNFPVTGFLQTDNWVLVFIFIALAYTGYRVARRQRPEEMLLLVWNLVMLLAIYGQVRWAYYFAVNIALMIGYVSVALSERIMKFGGWYENQGKNIGLSHALSLILVAMLVLFFVYPSLVVTAIGTATSPPLSRYGGSEPSGGGYDPWTEALNWMRYNTPDPGLDYFGIYEQPKNGTYQYPESAYGVMSWWDYGHSITYWAHRIPNANPFQAGIGGGATHAPGASTFLTAKSEEEANKVLDALGINGKPGARYIVSNGYMAYGIQPIFATWNDEENASYDPALFGQNVRPDPTNYYDSIAYTSQGAVRIPGLKSFTSMEGKLHILDGNGLKQYRLVHESPTNPNTEGGYREKFDKNVYNVLYRGNIPVEDSGVVKIFEYVKGAKITGRAPPNTMVTLTNTVSTNIGRTIQYSQNTSSDGTYEFTVPYSTGKPIAGQTLFDTGPKGPYTVTAGNISKPVNVKEEDVLNGGTVTLDLI